MENQENLKEKNIIERIYNSQEEQIDKIIKKANKEIKEEVKTINTETVIGNSNNPKEWSVGTCTKSDQNDEFPKFFADFTCKIRFVLV